MQRTAIVLLLIAVAFSACSSDKEPVGTTAAPTTPAQQPVVDIRDQDGRTQLMRTVETSDVTEVQKLIDAGANVNEQSYTGITALMTAAGMGKADIVKVLLAKKADVNAKAQGGFTALMQAALAGRPEVAKILLEAGADPNAEDMTGKTAADWAEEKKHKDIVEMIERRGGRHGKKR